MEDTNLAYILLGMFFVLLIMGVMYWRYRTAQGAETSNTPIRKALSVLLIAFIATVGLAPFVANTVVQIINYLTGWQLKSTQTNEVIGAVIFVVFCMAVVGAVYVYYAKRHQLYQDVDDNSKSSQQIINRKKVGKQINISENSGDIKM